MTSHWSYGDISKVTNSNNEPALLDKILRWLPLNQKTNCGIKTNRGCVHKVPYSCNFGQLLQYLGKAIELFPFSKENKNKYWEKDTRDWVEISKRENVDKRQPKKEKNTMNKQTTRWPKSKLRTYQKEGKT